MENLQNIRNRENFITMSRPCFDAEIRGNKYQISARFLSETIEDIEILCIDTNEFVSFDDEQTNDEILTELWRIVDNYELITF